MQGTPDQLVKAQQAQQAAQQQAQQAAAQARQMPVPMA
jgi:hypothetical protein